MIWGIEPLQSSQTPFWIPLEGDDLLLFVDERCVKFKRAKRKLLVLTDIQV